MSGGHFDYQQWRIREIADTIERDIARALRPKPAMVHEDYWVIDEMESPHSYHSAGHYHTFSSYEEAESFLLSCGDIVNAEQKYADGSFFKNGTVFQSTRRYMKGTADDEQIPVLYVIRHCVFDHYPYDVDVLELNDETIETMKEAYRQIRIAGIYADRVDWMMSGDDGENWRHWKKKSHQKTGLTLTTDGMSRSRKKFPAGVWDWRVRQILLGLRLFIELLVNGRGSGRLAGRLFPAPLSGHPWLSMLL